MSARAEKVIEAALIVGMGLTTGTTWIACLTYLAQR